MCAHVLGADVILTEQEELAELLKRNIGALGIFAQLDITNSPNFSIEFPRRQSDISC